MKAKFIGYICCDNQSHDPLCLGTYPDAKGKMLLLHSSNHATVFPTYAKAKAAITRTNKYAQANNLPWPSPIAYTKRLVQ